MSRHTFKTTHDNRPVEVAAGWDRPLQGFYMTVLYTDSAKGAEYEYAFNNLETLSPWPKTFAVFAVELTKLGIELPKGMADDIIEDGRVNMGNKIKLWDWPPTHMPPDPDGKNDERAEYAAAAIRAFQHQTQTDDDDALGDLLCDLQHFADREGYDFKKMLERAAMHYEAETRAEPTADDAVSATIVDAITTGRVS